MKKVAVVGYGVVGGGVADILVRNAAQVAKSAGEPIELGYIVDLRDFPGDKYADKLVKDFAVVEADPEVAVVVEAIGGCGAALAMDKRALAAGKSVVTSNKQLVAEHGLELLALAKEHQVNFLFEAAVGGGIPALNPLTQCLGANELQDVTGIVNGTTNYILTQMLENGADYGDALKEAQRLGYAEADPTADVEGIDAGRKACILADLAFGKNIPPEKITMQGISRITAVDAAFASAAGMKLKLLARALRRDGKTYVFVAPHFVPRNKLLAAVSGVDNMIAVTGSEVDTVYFAGPGAGRYPTASAVVGDVIDIIRSPGRPQPWDWAPGGEAELADFDSFPTSFYLRTRESREAVEQKLGAVHWLPAQDQVQGCITEPTTRAALLESGLTPDAVYPVLD